MRTDLFLQDTGGTQCHHVNFHASIAAVYFNHERVRPENVA